MPPAEYVVLVTTGKPETGLWCPDCLLPSRARVAVYVTSESGSDRAGDVDVCPECGRDFTGHPEAP